MPEENVKKELSVAGVRRTIAASLTAAFGFVIALLWKDVVTVGLTVAKVDLTASGGLGGWAIFVVTAVVLTVLMVVLIVFVGRWGSRAMS